MRPNLRKNVNTLQREIKRLAKRYNIQIIYAFGSREKEAFGLIHGKKAALPTSSSDLDIGLLYRNLVFS